MTQVHYYAMPGLKHRYAIKKYDNVFYIINAVANYYGITSLDIVKRTRKRPYVTARQIAIYLIKKNTDLSLKKVADYFGGYDHTTVIYTCRLIDDQISAPFDNPIKQDLIAILKLI